MEIFDGDFPPSMPLEIGILAMNVTVDYHKKVPIASFVGMALEIGRKALKYMLEGLNELLVESYCSKRYERDRDYSRNGQRERTIVTLGKISLNLTRVRDKELPIPYDVVDFESRSYQSDLKGTGILQ